jgi:hypothetical protein
MHAKGLSAKDLSAKDLNAKDLNAKDLNAKDLRAIGARPAFHYNEAATTPDGSPGRPYGYSTECPTRFR